jgi:zinc D-Ala-D-Ala carboxypeptidase
MELTYAQNALGLTVDGKWGPKTAQAIATAIKTDKSYLRVKLSPSFELRELLVSDTAARRGISNLPDGAQLLALARLCENVLQPVRNHFNAPVVVTSGLRSPALNKAVRGSKTSQHCYGEAADFTVAGFPDITVAKWIAASLPFDQLILEFPPQGWIHCSFGPRARRQTLTAKKGRLGTKYLPGLQP